MKRSYIIVIALHHVNELTQHIFMGVADWATNSANPLCESIKLDIIGDSLRAKYRNERDGHQICQVSKLDMYTDISVEVHSGAIGILSSEMFTEKTKLASIKYKIIHPTMNYSLEKV